MRVRRVLAAAMGGVLLSCQGPAAVLAHQSDPAGRVQDGSRDAAERWANRVETPLFTTQPMWVLGGPGPSRRALEATPRLDGA